MESPRQQSWNHWQSSFSPIFGNSSKELSIPGKRSIPQKLPDKRSKDELWRPGLRHISQSVIEKYPSMQPKPQSLKVIDFTPSPRNEVRKKKHVESPRSDEFQFRMQNRRIERNGQVLYPNSQTTKDFDIRDLFCRKRSNAEINQRNGIVLSKPGDKSYGSPERSQGFYSQTGLIPGSTVREWNTTHRRSGSDAYPDYLRDGSLVRRLDFSKSKQNSNKTLDLVGSTHTIPFFT